MIETYEPPFRAWAEIDLRVLHNNLTRIVRQADGKAIMSVVKAGAYGHGLERVAQMLEDEPISFFGVANVDEARRIADQGTTKKIYLLGPTMPHEREEIVARDWVACISDEEEAEHFNNLARDKDKKVCLHIAVDTGMGRGGFFPDYLCSDPTRLKRFEHLILDGLGSHLPVADDDPEFTRRQIAVFEATYESLKDHFPLSYRHLANSAGLMNYTIPCANLVRPGLLFYGYNPMTGEVQESFEPAFSLKSRISAIKEHPAGSGISYGRTYITTRPTKVATIGIGYGDGYARQLSGKGAFVYVGGKRCPLIGRVTMDQIMADVSDTQGLKVGDEVELIGKHIPIAEIAQKADTIVWDILTGIGPRVRRLYLFE